MNFDPNPPYGNLSGYSCGACGNATLERVPQPVETNPGAVAGAVVGLAVGGAFFGLPGAVVGGVIGAVTGSAVGKR